MGQEEQKNVFERYKDTKDMAEWLKGAISIFILVIVILFIIFGSVYSINEQQQGVVTTFGEPTSVVGSGLHFKLPIVQDVEKVDTTIIGFPIGYTNESVENDTETDESIMITSDYNFVNVDFYVEAKVSDPIKFLYATKEPFIAIKNICQGSVRSVISSYTVDSVITTSKNEIQSAIKEDIIEKLDVLDIGLQLINISMQDAEPPTAEIRTAFKQVENAKQSMDTVINNAEQYRSEQTLRTEAEADKILQNANATKEARIAEAKGQVARFNSLYEEYKKFPEVTRSRMFYEAMGDILPGLKVIIGGEEVNKMLPLEPFMSVPNLGMTSTDGIDEDGGTYNE